jgi:hypothetical protein
MIVARIVKTMRLMTAYLEYLVFNHTIKGAKISIHMATKIASIAMFVGTPVLPTNPVTVEGKLKIFSIPETKNMESNKIDAIICIL